VEKMLIDAHVHIFQNIMGYSGSGLIHSIGGGRIRCGTGEEKQFLPPVFTDNACTPELLLRYMDLCGVDKAVLMQGGFIGEQNEYAMEASRKYPDRLTGACTYDPYSKKGGMQLEYITESLGCRIIKLECSEEYGLAGFHPYFDYMDECFHKLMVRAERMNLTVVFDTGALGTLAYQPNQMRELFLRHSGVKTVIAHLGFPPDGRSDYEPEWMKMLNLGELENVTFDISTLAALGREDYPYSLALSYVEKAYRLFGARKLIFGSDFPGIMNRCSYQHSISFLRNNCNFLSDEEKNLVFHDNAIRVYGI
jgi:predicted TIM-barrel fold metal-dependent hydrolase